MLVLSLLLTLALMFHCFRSRVSITWKQVKWDQSCVVPREMLHFPLGCHRHRVSFSGKHNEENTWHPIYREISLTQLEEGKNSRSLMYRVTMWIDRKMEISSSIRSHSDCSYSVCVWCFHVIFCCLGRKMFEKFSQNFLHFSPFKPFSVRERSIEYSFVFLIHVLFFDFLTVSFVYFSNILDLSLWEKDNFIPLRSLSVYSLRLFGCYLFIIKSLFHCSLCWEVFLCKTREKSKERERE